MMGSNLIQGSAPISMCPNSVKPKENTSLCRSLEDFNGLGRANRWSGIDTHSQLKGLWHIVPRIPARRLDLRRNDAYETTSGIILVLIITGVLPLALDCGKHLLQSLFNEEWSVVRTDCHTTNDLVFNFNQRISDVATRCLRQKAVCIQ
jgi:hypothetical protein